MTRGVPGPNHPRCQAPARLIRLQQLRQRRAFCQQISEEYLLHAISFGEAIRQLEREEAEERARRSDIREVSALAGSRARVVDEEEMTA